MRLSYWNAGKSLKALLYIVLALFIILSLCGAKNGISRANLRDGNEITFKGFILEKPDNKRALIVETISNTDEEKKIYILINKKTKIGYTVFGPTTFWRNISYDNLKIEMTVLIKGITLFENNDRDILQVIAESIEIVE